MSAAGKTETRVEHAPAGNGTARPYQARLNGELLRTKGGVARRFKTRAAAQRALGQELEALLEASKGGNVPGITEDHRYEMADALRTSRAALALTPADRSAM